MIYEKYFLYLKLIILAQYVMAWWSGFEESYKNTYLVYIYIVSQPVFLY